MYQLCTSGFPLPIRERAREWVKITPLKNFLSLEGED
jgi:hypothetical protein